MATKPRRGCWPPRIVRMRANRALRRYMKLIEMSSMSYQIDPACRTDISLGDVFVSMGPI